MRSIQVLALAMVTLLAACGPEPQRVLLTTTPSDTKIRASVSEVEIKTVSLPAYAEAAELLVQSDSGLMEEVSGILWADDPARAVTHALVRQIATITGTRAAAEPWPFVGAPQADVSVRVTQLAVLKTGVLQFSGQFAVNYDDEDRTGRLKLFQIAVPLPDMSPASIATGYDQALRQLAERIARKL